MSISKEDFEYYANNKKKLTDALGNKGLVVDNYNAPGHVGLLNQGATCYLNSLLQCLCNDIGFRNAIFSVDPKASNIVEEIQKLFAKMQLSDCSAISTNDLSAAFGWERSQIFEQHDVHELLSVLVDSLSTTNAGLQSQLSGLFQGSIRDVLTCPACQHRSENPSTFLSLSVDLPDNLESHDLEDGGVLSSGPGILLSDLLKGVIKPEVLDSDNQWECSGCKTKVQATKAQEVCNLPPRLFLHLKRFRFDPTTRRRRKLTTSVLFPQQLDAHSILNCPNANDSAAYQLSTILVHNGTALGGHYRAYTKPGEGRWRECNDSSVHSLNPEDEASLFWFNSDNSATSDNQEAHLRKGLYESAYMLVYEKTSNKFPDAVVPSYLSAAIAADNEELKLLRKLLRVQRQLVEITVHFQLQNNAGTALAANITEGQEIVSSDEPERKCLLHVLGSTTLDEARTMAIAELEKLGGVAPGESIDLCRLRRYNAVNNRVGETYGGRENQTLAELGLSPTACMLLERRQKTDPPFVEFNPREMQLRLAVWSSSVNALEENRKIVVVPGEDASTVGGLRSAAAEVCGVPASRIALILNGVTTVTELTDDSKQLKKDFGLYPGDEIIVDMLPADAAPDFVSQALTELRNRKKSIQLFYNNPTVDTNQPNYDNCVELSLDSTLKDAKLKMATALGLDIECFHAKRNAAAPQLKDESKTMNDLGIVDQSILHLQLGVGCKIGEHIMKFELDSEALAELSVTAESDQPAAELISLGEFAIREKMSVLQLKEFLLEKWTSIAATVKQAAGVELPSIKSRDCIRIRDGKNTQASGPLRNDRLLSRCLMGLQDGRRLVVQVLPEPEIIGPDDLVLSVRVASYDSKILSRVYDLPMVRSTTVKDMYALLLAKIPKFNEEPPAASTDAAGDMDGGATSGEAAAEPTEETAAGDAGADAVVTAPPPESKYIAIAKGFSTGPPLTLKSALKLKWNDPVVLCRGESMIDHPPLNLRDGSLLVVRGCADFERAKAAVKARREAEGPRPASAGTGAAAVKARRPGSRGTGRYPSSLPSKEKGIKIGGSGSEENNSGNGSMPPPPTSPAKELDLGISGVGIVGKTAVPEAP